MTYLTFRSLASAQHSHYPFLLLKGVYFTHAPQPSLPTAATLFHMLHFFRLLEHSLVINMEQHTPLASSTPQAAGGLQARIETGHTVRSYIPQTDPFILQGGLHF